MRKTSKLRKLLASGDLIQAPGAYDALSATLVEAAGFLVVYMTGFGVSASRLGEPDIGLLGLTEMADQAARIADAVDIPVCADGDTGFGNALNVQRTVQAYEKAGVAAIQLEDQVFPKRCGHMLGRRVIPTAEMVQKLKAAADARRDNDFMIIGRTDARTVHGLDEALDRGHAYVEAGADIVFIESPESVEEMQRINEAFPDCPTLANMVDGGRTPVLSAAKLSELGFALAIYPVGPLFSAVKAMNGYLEKLNQGNDAAAAEGQILFSDFTDHIGLPAFDALSSRYTFEDDAIKD